MIRFLRIYYFIIFACLCSTFYSSKFYSVKKYQSQIENQNKNSKLDIKLFKNDITSYGEQNTTRQLDIKYSDPNAYEKAEHFSFNQNPLGIFISFFILIDKFNKKLSYLIFEIIFLLKSYFYL